MSNQNNESKYLISFITYHSPKKNTVSFTANIAIISFLKEDNDI